MSDKTAKAQLVLGIDAGTQGVRALVAGPDGHVVASASVAFGFRGASGPEGWAEQNPADWWAATAECVRAVLRQLGAMERPVSQVAALSVVSTSGTILAVDDGGQPLRPAILYHDSRATDEAAQVAQVGAAMADWLGYAFNTSFALPKIVWMQRHEPNLFAAARFIHAADFIAGRFIGSYSVTDHTNALKTGFDLVAYRWPDFIERDLGIPLAKLPRVVCPGEIMGTVSADAAEATGLPAGTPVVAGATDGVAAQLASGAAKAGAWTSSLGATLVLKGVNSELVRDPLGRVYSHLHPERTWWLPGAASNTGAEWMMRTFPGEDYAALDRRASDLLPTPLLVYPLVRRGERFPFVVPEAERFVVGRPRYRLELYAAHLEGVAYLERLGYETLQGLGLEVGPAVTITGGGARSAVWSRVRAAVLNRRLLRPEAAESAMGACLLAASAVWFESVGPAAAAMVRIAETIEPDPALVEAYAPRYAGFVQECRERGYIR